ncbi:MAG: hypothetical protein LC790_03880 [Actinobacteria bacterium]|nr:hypothetical protein [Actinomycetota bacterium]
MIRQVRSVGGLTRQANFAQIVLERETRRVHSAWREADTRAEVAAIGPRLEALTTDAARASGARTEAEINAFKKASPSEPVRNLVAIAFLEDGVLLSGGRERAALTALQPWFGRSTLALLAETEQHYDALVEESRRDP